MGTVSRPAPYLLIGTPCFGKQVTVKYAESLLKLQPACHERGIRLQIHLRGGDALITRARQNIVAEFLANDAATHLLFIDADIGFEPVQVFRLLQFDAPVSAAIYPIKRLDWDKIAACIHAGRTPVQSAALTYTVQFGAGSILARDGFVKADYAATGFLMVQREALLRMIESYPELHYRHEHAPNDPSNLDRWRYALFNCIIDEKSGYYLSEDYSFCRRWTDIGGEIWIDLQSRLTHVGLFNYEGDYSTQFSASPGPEA